MGSTQFKFDKMPKLVTLVTTFISVGFVTDLP